jgi:hypothetical protein
VSGERLAAIVEGARPPGVYRWRSRAHTQAVRRDLTKAGWAVYPLDGARIADPAELLEECATQLAFPIWFGNNWDALVDCLADLSWLPAAGYVLIWDRYGRLDTAGGTAGGKAWRQAYEVFQAAIASRVRTGAVPLYLLLRGAGPTRNPLTGEPIPFL